MLSKEQYISAVILLLMVVVVWSVVVTHPRPRVDSSPETALTDSLRRDSIARARALRDSLREARWEQKKDSFKRADEARFAQWAQERQARYDSARRADSLWRDSMGWRFTKRVKKDTVLDLNTADTTELMMLRGIGRYTARRLVAYREQLGGFYALEQLTDEPLQGLGLDTLSAHFILSPDAIRTIDVNYAKTEHLARHPYIRYEQARAIYQLRRKNIRLHSIDDLSVLPELDSLTLSRLAFYLRFE